MSQPLDPELDVLHHPATAPHEDASIWYIHILKTKNHFGIYIYTYARYGLLRLFHCMHHTNPLHIFIQHLLLCAKMGETNFKFSFQHGEVYFCLHSVVSELQQLFFSSESCKYERLFFKSDGLWYIYIFVYCRYILLQNYKI